MSSKTASNPKTATDSATISTKELAELTGYTDRRVRQLAQAGVITRIRTGVFRHPESNQAIIAHLGEVAAGRGGEDEQADLAKERALLARAQREGHTLKNQTMRHDLVSAADVEREWSSILSGIRGRMLALPTDVAQLLPHLTRHDIDTIDRGIRDALEELSEG